MESNNTQQMLGRLVAVAENLAEDVKEVKDLVRQQNGRVKSLELKHAEASGVSKTWGAIAGTLSAVIATIAGHFIWPK